MATQVSWAERVFVLVEALPAREYKSATPVAGVRTKNTFVVR